MAQSKAWCILFLVAFAAMAPAVLSRDLPLARTARVLTQEAGADGALALTNGDVLQKIEITRLINVDTLVGLIVKALNLITDKVEWTVDLLGTSDVFGELLPDGADRLTGILTELITTVKDLLSTLPKVLSLTSCTSAEADGGKCIIPLDLDTLNSLVWNLTQGQGSALGLTAAFSDVLQLADINSKLEGTAQLIFSSGNPSGTGIINAAVSTVTCVLPNLTNGGAFTCVTAAQQALVELLARATVQLTGFIGIGSSACANPSQLSSFIANDDNCKTFRILSIADALNIVVGQGVLGANDVEIDLDKGLVILENEAKAKAIVGFNIQSIARAVTDPILGQLTVGKVLTTTLATALGLVVGIVGSLVGGLLGGLLGGLGGLLG